jgi:hypothetical protein
VSSLGETVAIAYLMGAVVFGSVAFGGALARGRTGLKRATILGIGAGGAWPLVVLGVVQWFSIAAIIDAARWIARVRPSQPSGKAWRTALVPFGPTKHSGVALRAVDEREPELPVHTCCPIAPVELPGWGITFGPILVARLHRPTPQHIHSATESLAPASRP